MEVMEVMTVVMVVFAVVFLAVFESLEKCLIYTPHSQVWDAVTNTEALNFIRSKIEHKTR